MNLIGPSLRRRPSSMRASFGSLPVPSARMAFAALLVLAALVSAPLGPASDDPGLAAQVLEIRGDALPASLRGLPLVVLRAPVEPGRPMALVMSGDGNWARFIRELGDTLASRGIPVVGLESRAWMKHPRTPGELAADMERVLRHYLDAWSVNRFIIVGYSRGADWAPFLANRLPAGLRSKLEGVALFSPTRAASFEFHLEDLVRFVHRKTDRATGPELDMLHGLPVLCVYGERDKDALCPSLTSRQAEVVKRDAGHRLHDAGELADLVIARMGGGGTDPPGTPGSAPSAVASRLRRTGSGLARRGRPSLVP